MAKNPCIEAHASEDVKARYYKLVEEGMPPMEARRKAAMEEFSKLHKDLEKFKKLVNPKYVPKKYIEPDNTAKVKEITDTYAGNKRSRIIPKRKNQCYYQKYRASKRKQHYSY